MGISGPAAGYFKKLASTAPIRCTWIQIARSGPCGKGIPRVAFQISSVAVCMHMNSAH